MGKNNFEPWPDDWPKYYNSNIPCDMAVGPCACGGWHQEGEFFYETCFGLLLRYGKPVALGGDILEV